MTEKIALIIQEGDVLKEVRMSLNDDNFPRIVFVLDRQGQQYTQSFEMICPHGLNEVRPANLLGRTVEKVEIIDVGIKVNFSGGIWYVHGFKEFEVAEVKKE